MADVSGIVVPIPTLPILSIVIFSSLSTTNRTRWSLTCTVSPTGLYIWVGSGSIPESSLVHTAAIGEPEL